MPNPLAAIFCMSAVSLSPPKPSTPLNAAATPTFYVARDPPPGPAAQWTKDARATLDSLRQPVATAKQARNIILFIGDGMGFSTVTAARILDGQTKQMEGGGEENQLSFEAFPATALAKTYNVDLQVPESAGAMTAIMTGVKTRGASVGVDEVPARGECKAARGHNLATLLEQAKDAGLAAGVVTTARITHAVPAATYAHVSDRDWEIDTRMPRSALDEGCQDIARQLVLFDHRGGLDVVLGGGRLAFMAPDQADPQEPDRHGVRLAGGDLIAQWNSRNPTGHYVWSATQLKDVAAAPPGPILGLFAPDDMVAAADKVPPTPDLPTLADMTRTAIKLLASQRKGYVLVVDASGIDDAHHLGNASQALARTVELSDVVALAAQVTKDDTLIVVTADHGHTLTIGGYPKRGNPILGLTVGLDGTPQLDAGGRPYTTLAYANGPGHPSGAGAGASPPLTNNDAVAPSYRQTAATPLSTETHSGEDVPVYARGPGAQWVHGTFEQNVIYWIMRSALALPPSTAPIPSKVF